MDGRSPILGHSFPHAAQHLLIWLHLLLGLPMLLSLSVALLARKGGRTHILSGRIYSLTFATLLICGLAASFWLQIPLGFRSSPKMFGAPIHFFFAYLGLVAIDGLLQGISAARLKRRAPGAFWSLAPIASPILTIIVGLLLLATFHLYKRSPEPMTWFIWTCAPLHLALAVQNLRYWREKEPVVAERVP
jgi:hypothetical protein